MDEQQEDSTLDQQRRHRLAIIGPGTTAEQAGLAARLINAIKDVDPNLGIELVMPEATQQMIDAMDIDNEHKHARDVIVLDSYPAELGQGIEKWRDRLLIDPKCAADVEPTRDAEYYSGTVERMGNNRRHVSRHKAKTRSRIAKASRRRNRRP